MGMFEKKSMFEQPHLRTPEELQKINQQEESEKKDQYEKIYRDLRSVAERLQSMSEKDMDELARDFGGSDGRPGRDQNAIIKFAEMLKKRSPGGQK